ncbi:MAG: hypothetical protein IAE95_01000 [Chitinophagaceae bacterium]|nr:hypothetical protein [Chitinophagaceae bacterium]
MSRAILILIGLFASVSSTLYAGDKKGQSIAIVFRPLYNGKEIFDTSGTSPLVSGDTFSIDQIRFYCSDLCLLNGEDVVWHDKEKSHLVDAGNSGTLHVNLPGAGRKYFTSVRFNLGIDSTTNVSGVLGGDLDPAKGMYWTWQSGYINLKIEGICSKCDGRKYRLHLGGYAGENATIQSVSIPMLPGDREFVIGIETSEILHSVRDGYTCSIMIPGKQAVELSALAAKMFMPLK